MKNRRPILVGLSLFALFSISAQTQKIKKADEAYETFAYHDAIESYESLVAKGYEGREIYRNLGNSNYHNARYEDAASWYGKFFMETGPEDDAHPEMMYRYAQSLKSTGEYTAAETWMKKFETAQNEDLRAEKFRSQPDYLERIEKMSGRYEISNLAINSPESDFAPSKLGETLIFSTARDTGKTFRNVHEWNNRSFLNLYKATPGTGGMYQNTVKLPKSMNKKTHESTTTFTKDGKTVYFTRNNSDDERFERDDEGVSRLKIFRAEIDGDQWKNITELPFNGDSYSSAHPTLSPDGKKLFFASDREGSHGASDIFVVEVNEDGTFGEPKNLGSKINTESRETFPFITDDNILYFASDGHPGLGGLDIFAVRIDGENISDIINLGKPVNGEQDDFSFYIDYDTNTGFFASNRKGGKGSDDIYSFKENRPIAFECKKTFGGIVRQGDGNLPLANVAFELIGLSGNVVSQSRTDAEGNFEFEVECNEGPELRLKASKKEFESYEMAIDIENIEDGRILALNLKKEVIMAPKGTNLISYLKLEPIYFDLDKDVIRPDARHTMQMVIDYLKEYPQLKIEVQSHTDAKASDAYNMNLSARRAKNTEVYLIANGIADERISNKGFGESRLVNDCKDRNSCPDEKHQENRRSEFIVVD